MAVGLSYHCSYAWLPGSDGADLPQLHANVLIEVDADGLITCITPEAAGRRAATHLAGVVVPGFANAHSHAFHRALRGRTSSDGGTFWTWRDRMYELAGRLDPDSYLDLATATYAEMVLGGVTCVGEFHYLHHAPAGRPYDDPNEMAAVLREAARRAGIRLTLLDTCYLQGGIGVELAQPQQRFGDGTAAAWATRASAMTPDETTRVGVAVHSVRAVRPNDVDVVVRTAQALGGVPLHAHISEQRAENAACLAAYGRTPTQLLHEHGAITHATTAVHATHLDAADIALLGAAHAAVCFCPTTERDLADGIGPARRLRDAGAGLVLGSDQHTVLDLLEEARAMEMHERLASNERGRFSPAELVSTLTVDGHAALGWPEAGRLQVGAPADFVSVRRDTVRTAGSDPQEVLLVATAADVDTVVVNGRPIVAGGAHVLGDVARLLRDAIEPLWAAL